MSDYSKWSEKTTTEIRSDAICVSYQTRSGLRYVAQALGIATSDELGEMVLAQWLKDKHPTVVEHMKTRFEQDNEFKTQLKSTIGSQPPF